MTTLDTLGTARPDPAEVSDAALAMADFDAKAGDYAAALEWLGVAALHHDLTPEYRAKKAAWKRAAAQAGSSGQSSAPSGGPMVAAWGPSSST